MGPWCACPRRIPPISANTREIGTVRAYLDRFANLYPVGRNGMHRYNNQDHSMLAADAAVRSIMNGGAGKADIWRINTEGEYHEDTRRTRGLTV